MLMAMGEQKQQQQDKHAMSDKLQSKLYGFPDIMVSISIIPGEQGEGAQDQSGQTRPSRFEENRQN